MLRWCSSLSASLALQPWRSPSVTSRATAEPSPRVRRVRRRVFPRRAPSYDDSTVYPTEHPPCRQKQCLVNFTEDTHTPGTMTRKLKNYWTRVSEWTLQPSGVDTDSSESPAPRRARPPRAPPLRLRPRTPRAGPAAAPLRRPGARAASRRARARYPGEQRIQMGNLHPRATVETTCPVRDRLARAPPRAAAADGDRPPPQATAAVASGPSPPRAELRRVPGVPMRRGRESRGRR